MSVSQPSKEAVFIDVPTPKRFEAGFHYNFCVPDEGVEGAITGVPRFVLEKPSGEFDSKFIDQLSSRVPRFVRFDFSPVAIPLFTKEITDQAIRENNTKNKGFKESSYIQNNLDKIMNEDEFVAQSFTAINFNDQTIEHKLFHIISGTAMFLIGSRAKADVQSHRQLAREVNAMTSEDVTYQFLTKNLIKPDEDNTFFYAKEGTRIKNTVTQGLKNVNIHVQINSKFFPVIVENAITDPYAMTGTDFMSLHTVSKIVQQHAQARSETDVLHDDYKTTGKATDIESVEGGASTTSSEAKIVGYIIDKTEILPNGKTLSHPPIIIENPYASTMIDYNVKYYGKYVYSMKAIAQFTVPAIIEATNELVIAKLLISSHPTGKQEVSCLEFVPPPTPTDFNFHYDYGIKKLCLTWTYPPNGQRDIKKFQVFRRKTIHEPYQLMQVYDFDDTRVPPPDGWPEFYYPNLVKKNLSPSLLWIDPDFTKDSTYIYALASMDAHGFTSNYSEQFRVSFDRFKNKVIKERISSSGAPKPYPNMYLLADTFVDLVRDHGHKTMTIVFSPDALSLYDNDGRDIQLLTTKQDAGKYRFSIINTDIQLHQTVDVTLDDRRRHADVAKAFTKDVEITPATARKDNK